MSPNQYSSTRSSAFLFFPEGVPCDPPLDDPYPAPQRESTASTPGNAATGYPVTLENCGREITVDSEPERVMSLWQSNTEALLALGLRDKDVAELAKFHPPHLCSLDPTWESCRVCHTVRAERFPADSSLRRMCYILFGFSLPRESSHLTIAPQAAMRYGHTDRVLGLYNELNEERNDRRHSCR